MALDRYRGGSMYQGYWKDVPVARPAGSRATVTKPQAAYSIARGIRGPSSMGPYTRYNTFGLCWGATIPRVGGPGGSGESFGL
jgi:hypothetical protein